MRDDERARRDQQAAAARGDAAQSPTPDRPVPVTVFQQRTYTEFLIGKVPAAPDGSKLLTFVTPDGVAHQWPLGDRQARDLGQQLLAPSVQVAAPSDVPRNGHGPGATG